MNCASTGFDGLGLQVLHRCPRFPALFLPKGIHSGKEGRQLDTGSCVPSLDVFGASQVSLIRQVLFCSHFASLWRQERRNVGPFWGLQRSRHQWAFASPQLSSSSHSTRSGNPSCQEHGFSSPFPFVLCLFYMVGLRAGVLLESQNGRVGKGSYESSPIREAQGGSILPASGSAASGLSYPC